jgi:hypothetical protein
MISDLDLRTRDLPEQDNLEDIDYSDLIGQ